MNIFFKNKCINIWRQGKSLYICDRYLKHGFTEIKNKFFFFTMYLIIKLNQILKFIFMSQKKSNVANVNETKVNDSKKVETINLSKFADKLAKVELKEKLKKQTLYIYPDGFKPEDVNSDKGKRFRNSLRTAIKRFSNNISLYASPKFNDIEKLKKEVKAFKEFYKLHYVVNDLSLNSLTHTKDESGSLQLLLDIVKEVSK